VHSTTETAPETWRSNIVAVSSPPEVLDWCRANRFDYILGVAPTTTLRHHVADLEAISDFAAP
jgi:hypothetical protein